MSNARSSGPARTWTAAGVFLALGLVLGLALASTLRLEPEVIAQSGVGSSYQNAAVAP